MTQAADFRNQPRRRFTKTFKRELVEMLLEEAATVAEVAREYDLHPNQLFRWRTEYLRGDFGPVTVRPSHDEGDAPSFFPVELEGGEISVAPEPPARAKKLRRVRVMLPRGEIHLDDIDAGTLGMIIEALR